MMPTAGQPPHPPQDPAAQAMQTSAWLSMTQNVVMAQTIDRLAGLLVSDGLSQLVREILGDKLGPSPAPPEEAGASSGSGAKAACLDSLPGMGTETMKDLLVRSVVNRLSELNAINALLSLATNEHLRQWGTEITQGPAANPPAELPTTVPYQGMVAPPTPSWPPAYPGPPSHFWAPLPRPIPAPPPFTVPQYIPINYPGRVN